MKILPENFAQDLINNILSTYDVLLRKIYHSAWDIFMSTIKEHWLLILSILFGILIISIIIALIGRWGFFGSLMYNYLYFGVLFILGLIKGPEVFLNEYFEFFCILLLYPVCYKIVGIILDKTGLKNQF
ncbi:MAG: hypothetical protein PHS45_04385 [Bacilli bacterium]|nr:hypothetical protein [Bacilli bacterium]